MIIATPVNGRKCSTLTEYAWADGTPTMQAWCPVPATFYSNEHRERSGRMTAAKVAITDYTFDSTDVEQAILEPLGCRVVAQKAIADCQSLMALVADADYVITQFAPVNAAVIGA